MAQLAVFFDMFFGVSNKNQEDENGLLSHLEELRAIASESGAAKKRDSKSKSKGTLPLNMERELMLSGGFQLPTQCGITELENGRKVLTVRCGASSGNSSPSTNGSTASVGTTGSTPTSAAGDGEPAAETAQRRLRHFNLDEVYKKLWSRMKYTEYVDSNGNMLTRAFTGGTMVDCFVALECAHDAATAVHYLTLILSEEDVFQRLDAGGGAEAMVFEGGDSAFYRWRIHYTESNDEDNPVLPSSVMLGLRNDYGGVFPSVPSL